MSVQCIEFKTDLSVGENKASSIKQTGKLISQSVTENLKIRNCEPCLSDHVRLDRIAHRLVMGNKGRCKYPGCDRIVGSRAAITSLHQIKRNCFLEFSKTRVGLITWSHSYKWIVTCTQSIISVGNRKRNGESKRLCSIIEFVNALQIIQYSRDMYLLFNIAKFFKYP